MRIEQGDGWTLYNADCLDVLPTLTGVDAVVTDPPYGTGGWRRQNTGAGSDPSGTLVIEAWDDGAVDWLAALPPDVRVVCAFWPAARTRLLLQAAEAAGLDKHRCVYLRKPDPKPMPGGRIKWSVEPIWVLSRAGVVMVGGDDMVEATTPRLGRDGEATGHPYQKPLRALTWLLEKFPDAGVVADPFMGSGTTGVACLQTGRRFIGIEIDEGYFDVAVRRIEAAAMQQRLDLAEG